jgi:GTP cyclohydrolase I
MPTKKVAVKRSTTVKTPANKVVLKKSAAANLAKTTKVDEGLPLSVIIRRRIKAQNARFHANDNISAFIKPGELEGLVDEVAEKMQAV